MWEAENVRKCITWAIDQDFYCPTLGVQPLRSSQAAGDVTLSQCQELNS